MVVIGLAGIGIAGGLGFLDFFAERGRPFLPGEQAVLVELHGERKSLRFPRLAEDRTFGVAGYPADRHGIRAHAGSR